MPICLSLVLRDLVAGILSLPQRKKTEMRTLRLTIASTPTHAIYQLQGPSWLEHKRSFESEDSMLDALIAGLKAIPWLKLARKQHGIRTSGKLLRLTVRTHDAVLIEAGTYLRTLEALPTDLPAQTQELWRLLRKYDVHFHKLGNAEAKPLQQWAETVAA